MRGFPYLSSKEKYIVQRKKLKICALWTIMTLTCKTHVEVAIYMKTWNDPTVITDILPQTVPLKHIIKVELWTRVLISISGKHWIWKIGKVDLATKSQPPDCGSTSVSSREHVCWQCQPTNPQNLIEIDNKCMKNPILDRKLILFLLSGGRRQRRQPVNWFAE